MTGRHKGRADETHAHAHHEEMPHAEEGHEDHAEHATLAWDL